MPTWRYEKEKMTYNFSSKNNLENKTYCKKRRNFRFFLVFFLE